MSLEVKANLNSGGASSKSVGTSFGGMSVAQTCAHDRFQSSYVHSDIGQQVLATTALPMCSKSRAHFQSSCVHSNADQEMLATTCYHSASGAQSHTLVSSQATCTATLVRKCLPPHAAAAFHMLKVTVLCRNGQPTIRYPCCSNKSSLKLPSIPLHCTRQRRRSPWHQLTSCR